MDKKVWLAPEVTTLGVEMTESGGKKITTIDNIIYNEKGEVFTSYKS